MRPVESATIAELLGPYASLSAAQLDQVSIYLELLLKWNARINLTSVRDPESIIRRHFGESFFVAKRLLPAGAAVKAIDLGSGAGFPGLPLAIFDPGVQVTLIESNGKKATFLNEVIFRLKFANAAVYAGRAESFAGDAELVTMRAVEKFSLILGPAARLVRPGGRLALMVGSAQVDLAKASLRDLSWEEPVAIPGGHSRVLAVGTKKVKVEQ